MEKLVPSVEPAPPPAKRKHKQRIRLDASLAKRIVTLASEGKSAREISEDIGVSVATLNNWKGAKETLRSAVEASRRVADELVVSALFRRAVGYSHPAVKMFYDKERGIVTEHYTEHYPPDTTACMFWLKNRQRMLWQDAHELTGTFKTTIQTGEIETLASRLEQILRDTNGSIGSVNVVAAVGTAGNEGNHVEHVEASVQASDGGGTTDAPHDPSVSASAAEGLLANEGKDGGLARSE